jgi:dTDP-4-dehydrorhamnose 3,5-epimerase
MLISDSILITPDLFQDDRGLFRRHFCQNVFKENGITFDVKQTNVSENFNKGTLRGFHYQTEPFGEDKIITLMSGALFNVVIDLRPKSPTYLKHFSLELTSQSRQSLLIPKGCASAFLTLEDNTTVFYLMSNFFSSENYFGIRFDDPYFKIKWPFQPKTISEKDKNFPDFKV